MARAKSSWMTTALLAAPCAFGAACRSSVEVGAMDTCDDPGVVCDLDGGFSDAALPIGAPEYGAFDREAYDALRSGMAGDWHGVAYGFESVLTPLEMRISEASDRGLGTFTLRCLEFNLCVPLGAFDQRSSEGQYRLVYITEDDAGQGEFFWDDGINEARTSVRFRDMRLQRSGQVLSFVIDVQIVGAFQIVLQRGPWPDAGTEQASPDGGILTDGSAP